MRLKVKPDYKIYGNTFELRSVQRFKDNIRSVLVKRYIVSTEFIQLFYKCMDDEFDVALFNDLSDNEKFLLSKVVIYMGKENKDFNIAVSKFMKSEYEHLKLIEMAIKAGNLSSQLKEEYYGVIDRLVDAGVMKKFVGSWQKRAMINTPCN